MCQREKVYGGEVHAYGNDRTLVVKISFTFMSEFEVCLV